MFKDATAMASAELLPDSFQGFDSKTNQIIKRMNGLSQEIYALSTRPSCSKVRALLRLLITSGHSMNGMYRD